MEFYFDIIESNKKTIRRNYMSEIMKALDMTKSKLVYWVVGIILFLLLTAFYTIESGYVGVLSTFGKYSTNVEMPGFHTKIPIIQKVVKFNVKMHSINYKSKVGLVDNENITNKPVIRVLDNKNLPIGIELTVQFTPIKENASMILQKYSKNYIDVLINPIIRDVVRDVVGEYKAEDIAKDRSKIATKITNELKIKFKKIPFILNDVLLRDIQLPEIIIKKIQDVQIAQQEAQRLAIIEQQAIKQQKIKKIEAETKLIQVTTNAKAQAQKEKIQANAKAYKILKEATATQKANILISKSLTPILLKYEYIKNWNGKLPQTLLQKDGGVLLNIK
jgi:regulator of protease activity HflC (stomatin/prohibitin superfamily)